MKLFAAVHESGYGTKPRKLPFPRTSAFRWQTGPHMLTLSFPPVTPSRHEAPFGLKM